MKGVSLEVLSRRQIEVLRCLGRTDLKNDFYFTGGTALAAFYLLHRYSDDLDFFTSEPDAVHIVPRELKEMEKHLGASTKIRRTTPSFLEAFVKFPDNQIVKMDFALDSPFRFAPPAWNAAVEFRVDDLDDLAANKVSALFDRCESKDYVDVYFLHKEMKHLSKLIEEAKKKHLGMETYWLAQSFFRVNDIAFLPRMIKTVTLQELKDFFLEAARKLMDSL